MNRSPVRSYLPFVLALAAGAAAVRLAADTVLLRNGNVLQGEVIEEGPQRLALRFEGGVLNLPAREVLEVRRESRLEYLLSSGEAALRRDSPENAMELFRKARLEDPASEPARRGLREAEERRARELEAVHRYRDATAVLRGTLEREPGNAAALAALERIRAAEREAEADRAAGLDALARGDAEAAVERLRKAHERLPERRGELGSALARALILTADRALGRREAQRAEGLYLEAVSLDPDLVPAMASQFAFARAQRLEPMARAGKNREVLEEADEGLRVVPASEFLLYLRGIALEGLSRKPEAAAMYREVASRKARPAIGASLDTLRRAADVVIAELLGVPPQPGNDPRRGQVLAGDARELRTDHFIVFHRNGIIGEEVAAAAEEAYRSLREELGVRDHWSRPCAITLFPSREEFQSAAGNLAWSGGFHRIQRRFGSLADHQIFSYQTQPRLSGSIIPHEVAHAMLAHRVGYRDEIPLWFNEGFAIAHEPAYVRSYHTRVAAAAARTRGLIPLAELTAMKSYPPQEERVRLFYSESHTLTAILLEERKVPIAMDFIEELASAPEAIDRLLEKHYHLKGLKGLEARWIGELLK